VYILPAPSSRDRAGTTWFLFDMHIRAMLGALLSVRFSGRSQRDGTSEESWNSYGFRLLAPYKSNSSTARPIRLDKVPTQQITNSVPSTQLPAAVNLNFARGIFDFQINVFVNQKCHLKRLPY